MAIIKGEYFRLNNTGTAWDQYLFATTPDMVSDASTTRKWSSQEEKDKIATYLDKFNIANKLLQLDSGGKIPVTILPPQNYLPLAGGTLTGDLLFTGSKLIKGSGGIWNSTNTLTGSGIDMTGNKMLLKVNGSEMLEILDTSGPEGSGIFARANRIRQLGAPIDGDDAATMSWVQQYVAQGTHVIGAARVASTENVTIRSGVGTTIDGVELKSDDRVLLRHQTTATENGMYIVNAQAWHKVDQDSDKGSLVFVTEGSTNKGKQYYNSNGTKWDLFFIQDTYKATLNGGLVVDSTGFGFGVANKGIVNSMIADNTIEMGKISKMPAFQSVEGVEDWGTIQGWLNSKSSVQGAILDTLKIIAKIRGTGTLTNTADGYGEQTIAGAYATIETKNRVVTGTTIPTVTTGFNAGDIYLRELSRT